jgi:hypothetical protein
LTGIINAVNIDEGRADIGWNVEGVDEQWNREEGNTMGICEFVGIFAVCVCIIDKLVET